jgi:hypothetical protein
VIVDRSRDPEKPTKMDVECAIVSEEEAKDELVMLHVAMMGVRAAQGSSVPN